MNKYQEAKETLEKYDYSTKLELSEGIRNNITSDITVEQFFMMKETCIELLEKTTPKKVKCIMNNVIYGDHHSTGYCPNCNTYLDIPSEVWYHVLAETDYFSCGCGQKLDWND